MCDYSLDMSINRIRLEFKDHDPSDFPPLFVVLIESDWNLKGFVYRLIHLLQRCINRIRLEFKAYETEIADLKKESINRIRLEFKVHRQTD